MQIGFGLSNTVSDRIVMFRLIFFFFCVWLVGTLTLRVMTANIYTLHLICEGCFRNVGKHKKKN